MPSLAALTLVAVPMAVLVPVSASAAPTKAPNRTEGTAVCGADGTFTFVTNTGRSNHVNWSSAYTFVNGEKAAVFHPSSFNLVFSFGGGSEPQVATKHKGVGPVSCTITGTAPALPGSSVTGTVTGTLTRLG